MQKTLQALGGGLVCALLLVACQGSQAETLLNKANEEWIHGHNHSAVELFKAVLEVAPTGPYTEEALFRLGEIYLYGLNDSMKATNYFKEVVRENPKGRFRYPAQKHIAEIVETNFKDYDQAVIEYQSLIHQNNAPEDNPEHQFRIATLYIKKQSYDQAVVEYELLVEEYPESSWAEQAEYKIVELLYTLNQCGEARNRFLQYLKDRPMTAYKQEMYFVMASCLEEDGKLEEALRSFKALEGKYRYPNLIKMKLEGLENRIKKKKQPRRVSRKSKKGRRNR